MLSPNLALDVSVSSNVSLSLLMSTRPKWINPCGLRPNRFRVSHAIQHVTQRMLAANIVLVARNALVQANAFKENYVRFTFGVRDWRVHHEIWSDLRYRWLSSWSDLPKALHKPLSRSHLDDLDFDLALKRSYGLLQRFAVGLEQVALDQAVHETPFAADFNEAEYRLKAVLCELQLSLMERNLAASISTSTTQRAGEEDERRYIMDARLRELKHKSFRHLRDWYIFRDYINALEYVEQSFQHLQKSNENQLFKDNFI